MRKIFLTSGVILCMACPAFADPQDINASGQITVDNNSVNAPCTEAVLSDVTQNATNAFEAKWTPLTYTIAYATGTAGSHDANYVTLGTAGLPSSTTPVTFDSTNIALASPTTGADGNFVVTGYHFAGWESPVDLTNGNSPVSPATYILYQGTQASSPNGNYTGGTLASYGYANPAQNGTVTLNAHWVPNQYTITYNKGAGTGSNYTHTNGATFDTAYSIPSGNDAAGTGVAGASTAQSGYTFIGWSTDSEPTVTRTSGSGPVNTGTVQNAWTGITTWTSADATDLTVYAAYLANQYNLTYTCGTPATGVTPTGPSDSPQVVTYASGFTLAAANACTATGYHITGWSCPYFDGSNGGTNPEAYAAGSAVAAYNIADNSSCTGQWAANTTTIKYNCGSNAGSGSTAPNNGSAIYGQNFAFAANSCIVPTGSTFNGWKCKVGDPGAGDDLNATALYGNGVTSTTTQTAGGAGATWTYAGEHGGTITCVADITANSISLTWYNDTAANGGTEITPSNSEAESCTYGGVITIPANELSKTGYTFSGWHVRTSGGGNQNP